jgi:hypothetical protein
MQAKIRDEFLSHITEEDNKLIKAKKLLFDLISKDFSCD